MSDKPDSKTETREKFAIDWQHMIGEVPGKLDKMPPNGRNDLLTNAEAAALNSTGAFLRNTLNATLLLKNAEACAAKCISDAAQALPKVIVADPGKYESSWQKLKGELSQNVIASAIEATGDLTQASTFFSKWASAYGASHTKSDIRLTPDGKALAGDLEYSGRYPYLRNIVKLTQLF